MIIMPVTHFCSVLDVMLGGGGEVGPKWGLWLEGEISHVEYLQYNVDSDSGHDKWTYGDLGGEYGSFQLGDSREVHCGLALGQELTE